MFSSGLSLRQNIKATDDDLYNYKISNDGRVDVLETFKAGLEGTGEGLSQTFNRNTNNKQHSLPHSKQMLMHFKPVLIPSTQPLRMGQTAPFPLLNKFN